MGYKTVIFNFHNMFFFCTSSVIKKLPYHAVTVYMWTRSRPSNVGFFATLIKMSPNKPSQKLVVIESSAKTKAELPVQQPRLGLAED